MSGRMPFASLGAIALVMLAVLLSPALAPRPAAGEEKGPSDAALYQQTVGKAMNYLRKAQADDGSFSAAVGPGITATVTTAMLRSGRTPDDPVVAAALKYLEGFIRDDGGIHTEKGNYRNYETCLSMICFAEANKDGRYDKVLKKADAFVKGLQWDEEEGHDESSVAYGGAGYGRHKRPDLSNTSFLIDALKAAGNGPDDEAMKKALIFVSRCQNLETEHNTTEFAAKNPDGGFYYTCAAGGASEAGKLANGGLRSYGSMTYAGLKSMIFAGVGPDDPRVKAAYEWAQQHYTLEENPGMGDAGHFYYLHTFAKALDAIGKDTIKDASGKDHPWRSELVRELAKRQKDDGSWTNENSRWLEGDPNLVTAYALLVLDYCRPKEAKPGK